MFAAGKTKGVVATAANYIEDVFSTYLYTGNGSSSTRTITTGIDSSTYGSIVWIKNRTAGGTGRNNYLTTTALSNSYLLTNTTDAAVEQSVPYPVDPTSTGFNLNTSSSNVNTNGQDYASWTFRKQPKFFDVVTYTGDGSALKTITHNLGSTPGCMIIKSTSSASWSWVVYHQSLGVTQKLYLNTTGAAIAENGNFGGTAPTSTNFSVGYNATNESGGTYVAYLFAHNAGGFGLTGTDNVISCGSFTSSSIGLATVDLGYEPQWILYKGSNGVTNWQLVDNMRGFVVGAANSGTSYLNANTSAAEGTSPPVGITNTGFNFDGAANITYIYIAIRRGPMKVPTSGTSVFAVNATTGNGSGNTLTTNFPVDLSIDKGRTTGPAYWIDRLRGGTQYIDSASTNAELTYASTLINFQSNTSIVDANYGSTINTYVDWAFGRAPSFFDEVCYTGNGTSGATQTHNLDVVPELMIVKGRSVNANWFAYTQVLGATKYLILNDTGGAGTLSSVWNDTAPTSTTFTLGNAGAVNSSGGTYVAYLFATCAGVSKVGSYTGNGTTQTINCGFTGGARFVLIKRTDSTGDWYVYDTARGMTLLTDPYLLLNSTAAESATLGSVTTVSTGFAVNASILAAINTNGASYIFLAIA